MPVKLRSFEQNVKRMKSLVKLNYYPVSHFEHDAYHSGRTHIPSLHFVKDDKEYSLLCTELPSCCGSRGIISDQEIPLEILDPLVEEYRKSGTMMIFCMPQLPSVAQKLCDGVGIIKDQNFDNFDFDTLPYFKLFSHARQCNPSNKDHAYVNGAIRLNKHVYYFYDLNDNHSKLDTFLSCLNPGDVVLAISIRRQVFANRALSKRMKMVKKGVNPRTGRTLFLYYIKIGERKKRTLWGIIKTFIQDC